MEVEVALHSLSDRFADANYTETEEDLQIVYQLAEDVRGAICEYQVSNGPDAAGLLAGQFSEVSASFHK